MDELKEKMYSVGALSKQTSTMEWKIAETSNWS